MMASDPEAVGTAGFEPASMRAHGHTALPFELRSDVHRIPKGASYFRIARPLRFQVSHSTGFLVTNRRRICLFPPYIPFMKG